MDEKAFKAEARLTVLEYMLQRLYLITYASRGITSDQVKIAHAGLRQRIGSETFSKVDPAFSMLVSGELEDALGNFLTGLESMLEGEGLLKK